jgi:hypothetical protein
MQDPTSRLIGNSREPHCSYRSHVLHHILLVYDLALLIKVQSTLRAHGKGPVTTIVALEELKSITACHNTSTLIGQQWCRVALEYGSVMAKAFESKPSGQATQ